MLYHRRSFSTKARRALLLGTVGFILLQVGMAVAMEHWLPQLRDPYYGQKAFRLRCRTVLMPSSPPSVVMLGSSRVGYALRGQPVEEHFSRELGQPVVVYNFGMPRAGPVMELICLRRLLAWGIRPSLLLIEVFPPLLGGGQEQPPLEARHLAATRLSLSEILLLEQFGFPKKIYRHEWARSLPLVPWYAHRFAIMNMVSPELLPGQLRQLGDTGADSSGWWLPQAPKPTPERQRQLVNKACAYYGPELQHFCLCKATCRVLRKKLDICRQEGIPAALVLLPEATDFRNLYPSPAWTQIEAFLRRLGREFSVPIIDARRWVADEDFSDGHHLLPEGANVFTERLSRQVLMPFLEGTGNTDYQSRMLACEE